MRLAQVSFESMAPYSASKAFESERGPKESHDDYERRCCRERLNVDPGGKGIIPPMAFKQMLDRGAKNYPVKLKGNTTYTKYFESGVLVMDPLPLSVTRETVALEKLFVPSDGIPGSGKRAMAKEAAELAKREASKRVLPSAKYALDKYAAQIESLASEEQP